VVFLAPAFVLFTVFVAVPSVRALGYSLQKWDGLSTPEWVGLENFARLFKESDLFLVAFAHNVFLMLVGGSLVLGIALFFAAALHRRVRGAPLFRIAFFFPNVISSVAVSLLWLLLYSTTRFGVINSIAMGLDAWGRQWGIDLIPVELPFAFLDSKYLIYSIIPMIVWSGVGFYTVLFLAGMAAIPESFYEVARLEGASAFAQFRHITAPLIREVLVVGAVFLIIGSLKFFDAIWILENQWPTRDSHVLATLLYQKVFSEYNVGYGSAVAVLLFVLVFAATFITLKLSRREAVEY